MVTRLSKTRIHTDTSVALQGPVNYAIASGTDTYTADPSPAFTAYVTGAHYFISFTNANTSTTPTLNLNSLGAKTIVKEGTSALSAGDIPAGHKGILMYDGTYLVLMNPKAPPKPTIQVFTSSGTWTKPTGVTKIRVRVVGGGGGGGAAVTNSGSSGGTSSFGSYCSATGGGGGAPFGGVGGTGGQGSGGDLNANGSDGANGENTAGRTAGNGGASILGGSGRGGSVNEAGAVGGSLGGGGGGGAQNSTGYASGGGGGGYTEKLIDVTQVSSVAVTIGAGGAGGAAGGYAGGNGTNGVVIVDEY